MVKRKAVFLFWEKTTLSFNSRNSFFQVGLNFWTNQWGGRILCSHRNNRSAAVAVCFNRFPGDVITHRTDVGGHWLIAVLKVESYFLILVKVYGYTTNTQNKHAGKHHNGSIRAQNTLSYKSCSNGR